MTNNEKHRQDSALGVNSWVETTENARESEGFSAAAHILAGDQAPTDEHQHSKPVGESK